MKSFRDTIIEKSNPEAINEKNILNKKQLEWVLEQAKQADNIDSFISDIELMIQLSK